MNLCPRLFRVLKKAGLASGSAGAYTLARRMVFPLRSVSHAMPRPCGRHLRDLRTLVHAWWWDSFLPCSILSCGIRMAVPPARRLERFPCASMYRPCSSAMSLCFLASPILISCRKTAPIGDFLCSYFMLNRIFSHTLRSLIPFTFLVMYRGPGCGSIPSLLRSRTQLYKACMLISYAWTAAERSSSRKLWRRLRPTRKGRGPRGHA